VTVDLAQRAVESGFAQRVELALEVRIEPTRLGSTVV
jgi:hypothetical protein